MFVGSRNSLGDVQTFAEHLPLLMAVKLAHTYSWGAAFSIALHVFIGYSGDNNRTLSFSVC